MEDFTTYTVTGPDADRVNITSPTRMEVNDATLGHDFRVWQDKGAGFADGDIDLEIQYEITNTLKGGDLPSLIGFGDVNQNYVAYLGSGNFVGSGIFGRKMRSMFFKSGAANQENSSDTYTTGVKRYVTWNHVAGTNVWTCTSYTDPERTNQHQQVILTEAELGGLDLRYFFAWNNYSGAGAAPSSYIMENLEIIAPGAPQPPTEEYNPLAHGANF